MALAIVEVDMATRAVKLEASGFRSDEELGRAAARVRSLDQQKVAYLTGHLVQVTDPTGSRDAVAWAKAYGVLVLGDGRVLVLGTLGIFRAHAQAAGYAVDELEPRLPRRESPSAAGTVLPKGKYEATRPKRELAEALGRIRLNAAVAAWSAPEEVGQ
jgi:hypothetical protein